MEEVSERVVDQRLRNRIMESVAWLEDGLDNWGAHEYLEQFYDWVDPDGKPLPNAAMSEEEFSALTKLAVLMNEVCDRTPGLIMDGDLIVPGWLERIQSEASTVLVVFLQRGRCGEEVEEMEPCFEAGRAWYQAAKAAP